VNQGTRDIRDKEAKPKGFLSLLSLLSLMSLESLLSGAGS